jgi:hypothetical protein
MARVREFEMNGCNVIAVVLDPEDTRVCDYCNEVLISWDEDERQTDGTVKPGRNALVVRRRCHSTDYGLVCEGCGGGIEALRTFEAGDVVRADSWGNIEKIEAMANIK